MGFSTRYRPKNVALVGATGTLGSRILAALVEAGQFEITVLRRAASEPISLPGSVQQVPVDYESLPSLEHALIGQDTLICAVTKTALSIQYNLIDAAIGAGVKRFIPSEFGGDLQNPQLREFPTYKDKVDVENYLEDKARGGSITYTYVYTSAFLDWGLTSGTLLDLKGASMNLYDSGDHLFSSTTLDTAARAVVGVLEHPAETANRPIYIHDVATTQKRLLELAQRVTPGCSWSVQPVDTAVLESQARKALADGAWSRETFYAFAVRGAFGYGYGGHFERVDNELLGIKTMTEADLERLIQTVAQQA